MATLLLLQTRGRVTAGEVAQELEVSLATARRDLQALSTAGVPVYPQPGRGGGWQLVGGARTDLSGLTSTEATALMLLLGPSVAASPLLATTVRKLLRALPAPFRADAQTAAEVLVSDPGGWGDAPPGRPGTVDALQDAVIRRRRISFEYAGRGRAATTRVVDPHGLVEKNGVWYLVAGTPSGERTFRVDRMASLAVTDDAASRPADFDLARHWQDVVEEMEQRRSLVAATVLVDERLVPVLRALFGQHCSPMGVEDDGRTRVRVASHTAGSVAEKLAGLGAAAHVLGPRAVQAELARLGAELVARYAGTIENADRLGQTPT